MKALKKVPFCIMYKSVNTIRLEIQAKIKCLKERINEIQVDPRKKSFVLDLSKKQMLTTDLYIQKRKLENLNNHDGILGNSSINFHRIE